VLSIVSNRTSYLCFTPVYDSTVLLLLFPVHKNVIVDVADQNLIQVTFFNLG